MPVNKITVRRWRNLKASAFVATLALLAGCKTMPTSLAELPFASQLGAAPLSPTAALPPPSERTWPTVAQDELNQRARGFGLVNAPEMQRYLNGLYARIKTQAGVPDWPGSVHILANEALQAYATGAGNLYVSLPWLNSVQSEDELVALLSHEFGHVYLHYHQLEGAVANADATASLLALGVALVQKTTQATGWTDVDSMATAYVLGRGLVTTVYGRSQESAADNFGLNVSLKLGYSYEHGMKAFLERMASWEEKNEANEKEKQAQILKMVRERAISKIAKQNPTPNSALSVSLAQSQGEVSANVDSALQQFAFELNKVSEKLRSDHPLTVERMDTLALAVASIPELHIDKEPVSRSLEAARKEKRTATLLSNYALALAVLKAPGDPGALAQARKATTGVTASHALPLYALYTVLSKQPATARNRRIDPGQVLEANFKSESDRAWKIYQTRSSGLQEGRQTAAAKKVMDQGLSYFQNAEEAWPEAIRFYGETQGWDDAKRMAQNCGKNFQRMTSRCNEASASPAERATAERKLKEKSGQFMQKMLKTP
ncbi:M48 family metallopeptidase [Polaromonas sp. SM01]|uniref:M48 family metallopeptidase n=1 Tax=Polaromonas sp. SM01 TaxID=3085630 RepID=UPI002982720A|nr:M48 family metalloprotease [Polaromonas sp. SM01]MDW5441170.1 M48 family metalloprotease [Polaromonas sp. SM01]